MGFVDNWNEKVAASPVGWWFRLDGSGHVRFTLPPPHATSSLPLGKLEVVN